MWVAGTLEIWVWKQPLILSLSFSRLCVALTWPTAALQGTPVTLPHRCVRNRTCRGSESPWRWKRRRNRAPSFYPCTSPERLRTTASQLRRRARLSSVTTITDVLTAPPAARTWLVAGPAVHIPLWVLLRHSSSIRNNQVVKSIHTCSSDMNVVTGQLLPGWLPLLSHGLPLWRCLPVLFEAGPEVSFYSQKAAICSPCCPHCPLRGKKRISGGKTYVIIVSFYAIYRVLDNAPLKA